MKNSSVGGHGVPWETLLELKYPKLKTSSK
jgi:hypothetical protein